MAEALPEGLDTRVGKRGVKLSSSGQKQRVAIARIFLRNSPILILDEATSALDSATELGIQESLTDLARGRTTIIIAHRLATIQNANRIVVMDDTGIFEAGPHDVLFGCGGAVRASGKASAANVRRGLRAHYRPVGVRRLFSHQSTRNGRTSFRFIGEPESCRSCKINGS